MQKSRLIVLLVVVSILALSLPSMAQLASGNWPRPGRDYHNSGLSPATVIAKPVLKSWAPKAVTGYNASPYYWLDFTFDGIQIDPQGNLYVQGDDEFSVIKISPTGTYPWASPYGASITSHNNYYMYYGLSLFDDGVNQYAIAGPQQWKSGSWDDRKVYAINPSTGAASWSSGLLNDSWYVSHTNTARTGMTTNVTTSIGPDGSIYTGNFRDSYFDPVGSVFALDKTGARKWAWNQYGQGDTYGSAAIKQLNGKNIIYTASGITHNDATGAYAGYPAVPNILALQDDGTSASLLWSANMGFTTSQPVLSSDGNTLYVAGRDTRPLSTGTGGITVGSYCDTFFAFEADTGVKKWSLSTGARHAFSPTLGPNNMIYVCGGYFRTANQNLAATPDVMPTANPGVLVAIKDNGSTGEVKWSLPLPDDETSDTTRVAVISTTPTTMYVATGNGRVYCVQDMGTYAKILWTWQAFSTRWCGVWGHGFTPANIVVADDGTIYTGWKNNLYAFEPGYNAGSPVGISGTVKDAEGNPIANAWVAAVASTSVYPLADNANRLWTKTNSDGTYQITPNAAGTYNVAAAAQGYESSANQTAAFTTTTTSVTAVDFTLSPAKYNWALGASASATSVNASYPAALACDGDLTSRYASTAASSALTIDLGSEKTIAEAVIYWWYNYGKAYTLEYSTDGTTWATPVAYQTTTGNGGFPLAFIPNDAITNGYCGGPVKSADVIKFSTPIAARYWKVNFTSVKNFYGDSYKGGATVYGSTATYASIWDVELRDSTKAGEPTPNTIASVKAADDGDGVAVSNLRVTAVAGGGVPTDTLFVETADRTAGIKVKFTGLPTTIQFGDKVAVVGRVATDPVTTERYIQATAVTRLDSTACPANPALAELSMNNKAVADSVSQGLFIKTWGKVSDSATGSFKISDGSAAPIKVLCDSTGAISLPVNDNYIRVRGVVGKDADGPVLYMRNERADWAYGSDNIQALPFTGNSKYPVEYLVLGPFTTDPAPTNAYDLLGVDFIGETTIGTSVMPAAGLVTAGKTWFASSASSAAGILDFNKVFGVVTSVSAAYAHLYLWSETEAPTVAITTGSDDWLKVYVNGSLQYTKDETAYPTGRGVTIGQDGPTAITLHQGLNSILFKVVNGQTGFGINSQFTDVETYGGTGYGGYNPYAATGLGYSLNPGL
ncbi:MAG: discoidin domain-containing protein [Armatimonadota bacterium]